MQEAEALRQCSFDGKPSGVTCTVMCTAEGDEILDRVRAAFGARPEMVHIDKSCVPAAGHLATAAVKPAACAAVLAEALTLVMDSPAEMAHTAAA